VDRLSAKCGRSDEQIQPEKYLHKPSLNWNETSTLW
jgi:hypothetical protein